jgi:hypothetical protein
MTEAADGEFLNGFFHFIDPHLSANARKEIRGVQGVLELFPGWSAVEIEKAVRSLMAVAELFPGSTPAEIEKSIRGLLVNVQTSIPSLAERASKVLAGTPGESADKWLADVGKLKVGELIQLLKALNMPFAGAKPAIIEVLRKWVESGGQNKPPDPKEQLRSRAAQYTGDLAERIKRMDPQTGQEVLRATEAAYKDKALGISGFEIFANLLGIPAKGTKKQMFDQVKDYVNTILVSRQQTAF